MSDEGKGSRTVHRTTRANSPLAPLTAIVVAIFALAACSDERADTDPTVGSTSATTQATSTTTASTTTVDSRSTTTGTSTPTAPPLDWQAIDSEDLVSSEKGGAFGVVLATGSNSWLAAGEVNDPDRVPLPTAWVSDDGVDWTSVDLPGPSGGAYVNTGAWSGDRGILAGPEATTPGAVWLVRADGSAEEVAAKLSSTISR